MMRPETLEKIRAGLEGTPLEMPLTDADEEWDEIRLRWVKQAMHVAEIERCMEDVRLGRVYSIKTIAEMFHCSNNTAWRMFRNRAGVFRLRSSYRVPETVFNRVLHEILQGGDS
jgi:hypothetical protein